MSAEQLPNRRHLMAQRLEDLRFMAAHGETHVGAAERLGLKIDALQAWCSDNDRTVWARLVANSHAPGSGARRGRVTKAIA